MSVFHGVCVEIVAVVEEVVHQTLPARSAAVVTLAEGFVFFLSFEERREAGIVGREVEAVGHAVEEV